MTDREGEVTDSDLTSDFALITVIHHAGVHDDGTVDACPGCGRPVQSGEDFVVAQEYELETGSWHAVRKRDEGVARRFHVGHFRGRMGRLYYELREPKRG